jgi:polyisoprenoid-binding protein YceI
LKQNKKETKPSITMKTLFSFIIITLFIHFHSNAQVYLTYNGQTSFFSETPIENISAENKSTTATLNITTKEVVVKIKNDSFKFLNKLMEEHFNNSYMESGKYPVSTFSGKIVENINLQKKGSYQVTIKGILEMHGVKHQRTIKALITNTENFFSVVSNFNIKFEDYKIDTPKLVYKKIAESIIVKNSFVLTPKRF